MRVGYTVVVLAHCGRVNGRPTRVPPAVMARPTPAKHMLPEDVAVRVAARAILDYPDYSVVIRAYDMNQGGHYAQRHCEGLPMWAAEDARWALEPGRIRRPLHVALRDADRASAGLVSA